MEEKRKDISTPPPPTASSAAAETPASEPTTSRRRGGGQKRKASALGSGNTSTPPTTSSKRQTREKSPPIPFPPIHNGPLTRARQQPNIAAAAAASSSPSSAYAVAVKGESDVGAAPPQPDAAAIKAKEAKEAWEALEAKIEKEYEAIKSRDANAHVVPTHAGWFSWRKVHPLEEKMLPSFFNGKLESRTPEAYMEMRNWIMRKYHANPNTQIELKDLSELSVGDMEARQEVMEFLDYWGLINFHPFPTIDSAPTSVDGASDEDAQAGSLIESLFRFETEDSCTPVIPSSNLTIPALPSGLFPESSLTEDLVKSEGPSVEYHCNSCSADCSRKRYHCQKQADFDLCTECFNNGKFGSDMSPSDFILMEPAEVAGASGGKWTDQETLLLLEALELYKENWNEIAEHVATKTKAQCILHFVEMPIEDTFLDSDDGTDGVPNIENADAVSLTNDTSAPRHAPETTESKEGTNENQPSSSPLEISKPEDIDESNVSPEISANFALKALREAFEAVGCPPSPGLQLSFADAGNPVMALAAFLVRLVEPNTATAAVRSSVKSISGHCTGEQLAARHCFHLEDPPEDKEAADSERVTSETMQQGDQKDEDQNNNTQKEEERESVTDDQNDTKQKEEKLKPVTDGTDSPNDHSYQKDKDGVAEKDVPMGSSSDECADKSDSVKTPAGVTIHQETEPSNLNESKNQDLVRNQVSDTTEKSNVSTSKTELHSSAKDSGDTATVANPAQSADAQKDKDMISVSDKEPDQLNTKDPVVGEEGKAGGEEAKESKIEKTDSSEPKTDVSIDRTKHAAVTALSAAAVKAKILATQEEDQIQQLATLLIEKQLYKLEMKLAFFNDMENVVMRVREQLERSKQRLYHERAQIIATRLGISGSTSRPMSQSLPANRVAMAVANSAARPPVTGTSIRPPFSRPMMGPIPNASSFMSAPASGNSVQLSNQESLSSVTTK